jgi:hypothetical protein
MRPRRLTADLDDGPKRPRRFTFFHSLTKNASQRKDDSTRSRTYGRAAGVTLTIRERSISLDAT